MRACAPSTGQLHENDPASLVIVCAPSALSKMMGSLHPAGALYEKPVNIRRARDAHSSFVSMLKRKGATVCDVRAVLTDRVEWSVGDRIELEKLAFSCLSYVFREVEGEQDAGHARVVGKGAEKPEEFYVSDTYKQQVIEEMGEQQLVDIIFTNPTVIVAPSPRDTGFKASYRFDPLSNIVFVRDQQITTKKGIVMARLRSTQRHREVDILEFCFRKLGLNIIGRIPSPGHLEGGDFFPVGEELSIIGIGPRSDWEAVQYLLEHDLFGTKRVAVVKDDFEKKQERMHLDTVFNILGSDCCLMLQEMMGDDSPTKRVVDEYTSVHEDVNTSANGASTKIGNYSLKRKDVEFSQYMRDRGFSIIKVSGDEQLNYGCNVLNLGNGNIISIEKATARKIACSKDFKGTVEFLDFSAVTSMYGGVHCASQVVCRDADLAAVDAGKDAFPVSHITELPAATFADDRTNGSSD